MAPTLRGDEKIKDCRKRQGDDVFDSLRKQNIKSAESPYTRNKQNVKTS